MTPDEVEAHRHLLEARDWLRRGYTTPLMLADLGDRIAAKRGWAAADRLIGEMKQQWDRREEWMGENHG